MTFPEVAKNMQAEEFLKTQRQKFEEARVRVLLQRQGSEGKQRQHMRPVPSLLRRQKMKMRLRDKKSLRV